MATNEVKEVHIVDEDRNTNLHVLAACDGHEELMEFNVGQKIDSQNSYGWTPLMMAARHGHLESVQVLLEKRADASKSNKYNGSVFLMAVASGNLDLINVLLQHLLSGGVSRRSMEVLFSPVAMAILFNHEDIFKFLLMKGFNAKPQSLYTNLSPLRFAAMNDNPVFLQHLQANGVDVPVRSSNNETTHQDLINRKNGNGNGNQHQPFQLQITQPPIHPSSMVIVNPQPTYFNTMPRKSSNAMTPEFMTPTISPVCYYPQIFFPPDFSPTYFTGHDYHGWAFSPYNQDVILSPVFTIESPSSNVHNRNISYISPS